MRPPLRALSIAALHALVVLALVSLRATPSRAGTPAPASAPFSVGLNYPWYVEGSHHFYGALLGEMTDDQRAAITRHLDDMAGAGIRGLRIWLMADGWRWPERDGQHFRPLPPRFVEDLRWFIRAAHAHGIDVIPSLFDFYLNRDHPDYITSGATRDALVSDVVAPLVLALAGEPGVRAWDVINEPEWCVRWRNGAPATDDASPSERPPGCEGIPRAPSAGEPIPLTVMQAFIRANVAALHAAGARATVGSAGTSTVARWSALGLDEYQVHFYPPAGLDILGDLLFHALPAAASLHLDRPVLLGEFPPNIAHTHLAKVLGLIRDKGYAGAWAWSFFGQGTPEDLHHRFSYHARRDEFKAFTSAP